MVINSLDNSKIKNYRKLLLKKYRDKSKTFLVEGFHLVEEAKKVGLVVETLTTDPTIQNAVLVSERVLKSLSTTETNQGIIAVCQKPRAQVLGSKVLVLENIQDPGNVGTLIRSAVAFGYSDVIVSGCDVFNEKVVRASQGAIFKVNLLQVKDVSSYLNSKKFQIVGAVVNKYAKHYTEPLVSEPFMLVLGNESSGISQAVLNKLTEQVYIPINFESLNVASAGAILLNHFRNFSDEINIIDL